MIQILPKLVGLAYRAVMLDVLETHEARLFVVLTDIDSLLPQLSFSSDKGVAQSKVREFNSSITRTYGISRKYYKSYLFL